MRRVKIIPTEIDEIMSYLAKVFADSMRDPVQDKEDLYQDLVVLYLETLQNPRKGLDPENKNHWFIFFKTRLTDKYRRLLIERRLLEKVSKELNEYYGTISEE